ncbi:MAG TPA: DegT/DnrJ/EryC1/StrS family aminotransferase [Spirochaetota bacterium]|nr:DegT/DnrJ/EryC1/StrS family aminotransferase [Spirochaetota bacterium]
MDKLAERGINTSVHFIPLYRFTYFKNRLGDSYCKFPSAEWVFEREISLPIYPSMKDKEIAYVIDNVIDIAQHYKR